MYNIIVKLHHRKNCPTERKCLLKTCKKCAVAVSGNNEKCPLCQNMLSGDGQNDNEVFPFVPIVRYEHGLLFRLLQLCSAAIVIVAFTVNWMIPENGFWSLFVIAGVGCLWLSLTIAIRKRNNVLKNLTYQVTIVSILSVLWDIFTGWHGWSIDFVIPITFAAAMSVTTILSRILKLQTETYMIYLVLLILYGIIPAVFILTGFSQNIYPSVVCVAGSLFSFAALLIFEGRNMIEELKRRMHL